MLLYLVIGTVVILGLAGVFGAGVLLAAVGTLYGENKAKNKWIVELRRREHRSKRETELWQSKAIERAGLGPLRREHKTATDPKPPARRFVAPSQAINELKKDESLGIPTPKQTTGKVPPAIGQEFLEDAGRAVSAT
jgi:hypothetical protein